MNPERFAAWQAALQTRDQAMLMFGVIVGTGIVVWLLWARERPTRRRWVLGAWLLVVVLMAMIGGLAS